MIALASNPSRLIEQRNSLCHRLFGKVVELFDSNQFTAKGLRENGLIETAQKALSAGSIRESIVDAFKQGSHAQDNLQRFGGGTHLRPTRAKPA